MFYTIVDDGFPMSNNKPLLIYFYFNNKDVFLQNPQMLIPETVTSISVAIRSVFLSLFRTRLDTYQYAVVKFSYPLYNQKVETATECVVAVRGGSFFTAIDLFDQYLLRDFDESACSGEEMKRYTANNKLNALINAVQKGEILVCLSQTKINVAKDLQSVHSKNGIWLDNVCQEQIRVERDKRIDIRRNVYGIC